MEVPLAERLTVAQREFREQRVGLYERVKQDPEFRRENITLYDFDILENASVFVRLLEEGAAPYLDKLTNRTAIDIGCSNGDLGFVFEDAGFEVALLDKSHVAASEGSVVRQNAPLVASVIAKLRGSNAMVFDENIDLEFDPATILERFRAAHPGAERIGLGLMFGVLYHLKNPYSTIEKLASMCEYLVVGTWVADRLPNRSWDIADEQVVYLLKDRELAADPTNFWIFTPRSFEVLAERSGWEVCAKTLVRSDSPQRGGLLGRPDPNLPRSRPDDVKLRSFLFLRSTR